MISDSTWDGGDGHAPGVLWVLRERRSDRQGDAGALRSSPGNARAALRLRFQVAHGFRVPKAAEVGGRPALSRMPVAFGTEEPLARTFGAIEASLHVTCAPLSANLSLKRC
jgi:hypothetical protein